MSRLGAETANERLRREYEASNVRKNGMLHRARTRTRISGGGSPRLRRRGYVAAVTAFTLACTVGVSGATAATAAPATSPPPITWVYEYSGASQTVTPPPGVRTMDIEAVGAEGGTGDVGDALPI